MEVVEKVPVPDHPEVGPIDYCYLRDLCFRLNVDYQDLPGGNRSGKARELVMLLERQDRLVELVKIGKKRRLDITWAEW